MSQQDLYETVTQKIIANLEAGVAPWVKPWKDSAPYGGMPFNAISGKRYRGINVCLLAYAPFASNAWMTFKQAKDIGANVRKGEHGSIIVFFKPYKVTDRNAPRDATGNQPEKTIPVLRSYYVFNLEQIENLPEKFAVNAETAEPLPISELMAQANVVHGGDRAYYHFGLDQIRLPHHRQFRTLEDYQATALHELTHWTGHSTRCAREYGKRFGDQAYAREELVAEMGAAFLCAACGIDGKLQHADYIANWLQVLKSDKRAVLIAASHAQKAADYVLRDAPLESESSDEQAA